MKISPSRIRGFSLIELMVVMFIIGIIAAFIVPTTSTILRGSQMTQGSQILYDQFNLARQYALSRNHPVEVRLIRFADPEVPGEVDGNGVSVPTNGNYRAIQIFETLDAIDPTTQDFIRVPLDKPAILPQAIVMNKSSLSTLLREATGPPAAPSTYTANSRDPQMPRKVGTSYDYVSFRFMPDGSTNLPTRSGTDSNGAWYVTLQNINDPASQPTPPANFYTIQVDPVSGSLKQFRPGI